MGRPQAAPYLLAPNWDRSLFLLLNANFLGAVCVTSHVEAGMGVQRLIRKAVLGYLLLSLILAICLGELAFRPQRVPITRRKQAGAVAAQFGGQLQDVSVTATDGIHLKGWFARPANANGDAVMLFHGVGDNRQGMMGIADLLLSNGFAVLVPDSRAHGESGGDFPTYGIKERDDVHQWLDWLVLLQHPRCVFGMGESMGAAILLQAIEKETLSHNRQ